MELLLMELKLIMKIQNSDQVMVGIQGFVCWSDSKLIYNIIHVSNQMHRVSNVVNNVNHSLNQ